MKGAALIWLLLVAVAALFLAIRLGRGVELQTDLLALLPQEERDPAVERAKERITTALGQRIILLVGHEDRAKARAAGSDLSQALLDSGPVSSVDYRLPNDGMQRLGTMFFPFRLGLLSASDRTRLEQGRGIEIVNRALATLYGPVAIADRALLRYDPFFLLPSYLAELPLPLPNLIPDDGILSVQDGAKTYVFLTAQLTGNVYSLALQDRFMAALASAEQNLRAKYPGLELLRYGAVFYAHAGAKSARDETSAIGLVSLVGTIFLILGVFRALRPLWLTILAIGVGVLCAFSASLWLFGALHVLALLFGVSLVGIATDYCLQYVSARFGADAQTPQERLRQVLPGISLGIATTFIGYVTLLFAPFPGLHQVAVFSAVGLVASFLTVLLWLPALDRREPLQHGDRLLAAAGHLWAFWEAPRYRWPRFALIGLSILMALIGTTRLTVDDDIRHFQPLSADLKRQEAEIRRLTGLNAGTEFVLVRAPDDEIALQREESLLARLNPLQRSGAISGFQAAAQIIPSIARQRENRALIRDGLIAPFLSDYCKRLGIPDSDATLEDAPGFLTPAAIGEDSPFSFIRNLIIDEGQGGVLHLVPLGDVLRPAELQQAIAALPGISLVDPTGDITRLLGDYRRRAVILLAVSAVLMLPILMWRYGVRSSARVALPPALAVFLTPPLVALAGVSFTFFNAMALVLVLSIGFDYAVFCRETKPARRSVTMLGVWLALVTTLLSFGLLSFSQAFAVRAFGLTLLAGTILAFVFSPLAGDSTSS